MRNIVQGLLHYPYYKAIRPAMAWYILNVKVPDVVPFDGNFLPVFYHGYNETWLNERQVEIPIFKLLLHEYEGKDVLEVGHVLKHYLPHAHLTIDKYERGPGVVNVDFLEYNNWKKYDLVFSISTFEHIGFNYQEVKGREKPYQAINKAMSMLKSDGLFAISFTLGYNPVMDDMLKNNKVAFDREYFYKRLNGRWQLVHKDMIEYLCCHDQRDTREVFIGMIYNCHRKEAGP